MISVSYIAWKIHPMKLLVCIVEGLLLRIPRFTIITLEYRQPDFVHEYY